MTNLKISKELINQVYPVILEALGDSYTIEIVENTIDFCQNSKVIKNYNLLFSSFGEQQFEISLESFAFKCKEWAFKRELNLWTDYLGNCQIQDKDFQLLNDCYDDTEIECILKACNWILENIK